MDILLDIMKTLHIEPQAILIISPAFLVSTLVLYVAFLRPWLRVTAEREARTVGARKEAAELEGKFRENFERFERFMGDAHKKATDERARIRSVAQKEQDEILSAARDGVAATLGEIRSEIAAEQDSARKTLETKASELALELAEKVLGRKIAGAGKRKSEGGPSGVQGRAGA